MSVRYDPILTACLAAEIEVRWTGSGVRALVLGRDRDSASLLFADGDALHLLLHPSSGYLLGGAAGAVQGEVFPFRRLRLLDCRTPPDERLLILSVGPSGGEPTYRVMAELRPNRRNVLLVAAATNRIEAALRTGTVGSRPVKPGAPYRAPASSRRWIGSPPALDEWVRLFEPVPPSERRALALREVGWSSGINVDAILADAASSTDGDVLRGSHERFLGLREAVGAGRPRAGVSGGWLLERRWGRQPYPSSLGEAGATPAGSLLEAMEHAAKHAGAWPPEHRAGAATPRPGALATDAEAGALQRALERRLRRLERRRAALERELGGPDADHLRRMGHLLLAHQGAVRRGAPRATLPGYDGGSVEIELDPALGPVENAERYYAAARRRERAARLLPREFARASEEVTLVRSGLEAVVASGPSEELWRLAGGRPEAPEATRDEVSATLPYRRLRSTGGLEIRVGRGARANDELTFHHASPEDIWLHARQVRGAHVILRWDRREENPPQRDLIEAAVAAALNSEARHSGTVAVDWTRRKHVRKPRKAPPGAVIPERVKTLFVEPDPAVLKRLKAQG
ncbi:MAG: NFACT RNA binding domain-containing protein [Gemmatimonadota bacterium]